ncbi:MAG TPA: GFA family protein [Opitutaceae bacterium]|nr:GFA family protein [Opitutaceae bacterium]
MKHSRGSCVCGAVRYELSTEPIALFCCHCTECQTASGASFVLALKMPYGGVSVIQGEAKPFFRPEADGQTRDVFRCPKCLAALWSERLDSKEHITVYAGTLDDSSRLKPVAHIWTRDAQPWIELPKEALQFPENPPDLLPIIQAWCRETGKKA